MKLEFREFHGPSDWGWVQTCVPILRVEDTSGIMAIDSETNTTVGAVIFDNWTENSVQTHFMISSPLVLKHGFMKTVYQYVFDDRGLKYMYGLVPANNTKAVAFNSKMGWIIRTVLPEAFAKGVDYLIMELTRANCKYLDGFKHG